MTEKQLTAVEWLIKQIIEQSNDVKLFEKALHMERKQIETAYNQGIEATFQFHYGDGKQYFTDTYENTDRS